MNILSNFSAFSKKQNLILVFTMGWDSPTFWNKGTEFSSLSRDKGTMGQAQNLAKGRDGLVKIRDGTWDGTVCPIPRDKVHNMFYPCSELGTFMSWTSNSMNKQLSYCGLVDARISASEKDLPVIIWFCIQCK